MGAEKKEDAIKITTHSVDGVILVVGLVILFAGAVAGINFGLLYDFLLVEYSSFGATIAAIDLIGCLVCVCVGLGFIVWSVEKKIYIVPYAKEIKP